MTTPGLLTMSRKELDRAGPLLGDRPAHIVPILAGLGRHQAHGTEPDSDDAVVRFLDGVRELVAARPGRVVVIAGADLAHTGPRFGDPHGYDERERSELEARDRASLDHATAVRPAAFWGDVAADLETRRVCGLAYLGSILERVRQAQLARDDETLRTGKATLREKDRLRLDMLRRVDTAAVAGTQPARAARPR